MAELDNNGMYKARPRWTVEQMLFLQNNMNLTDEQMAEATGRSLKSVRQKRLRLKFKKAGGRPTDEVYSNRTGKTKREITQERSQAISKGWQERLRLIREGVIPLTPK